MHTGRKRPKDGAAWTADNPLNMSPSVKGVLRQPQDDLCFISKSAKSMANETNDTER